MSKTARLYKIEALIRQQGEVTFKQMLAALEVSPATLKRDLEYLRSQLGATITYDAASRAYRFAAATKQVRHELPGLWFDERELYALLTAYQLLGELRGGLGFPSTAISGHTATPTRAPSPR